MTKPSVEAAVSEVSQKFKQLSIHHRIAASHRGSFMLDMVRICSSHCDMTLHGAGGTPRQIMTPLTPQQIVERAEAITTLAFERVKAMGDIIDIPPFDDLRAGERDKAGF